MIRLQNVLKRYGKDEILRDASYAFPDRGLVCVLGPSGCGKSTLLNLLAGFDTDYGGTITVHGSELGKLDAAALAAYRRDNVGFIFQNYHLLSGYTALENLLVASDLTGESREAAEEKARALLEQVGLGEKAEQRVETLSGGQKQRVAIARALMGDPSILLADEPTGALDRKNSGEIMELLKKLAEKCLVILITHDRKCADYAGEIVRIQDGALVAEGTPPASGGTARLQKRAAGKIPLRRRAVKNFRVRLGRYLAVALAISVGVLCFTLSLSAGNVMDRSIADFQEKNTAYQNGSIRADGNEAELLKLLSEDGRLENVYAQYVLRELTVTVGETAVPMAEKYPMARAAEQLSFGVMPRRGAGEIALSPSLAAKFSRNIQELLGETAELTWGGRTWELTISGIFNAGYDDFYVSSDVEQTLYEGIDQSAYAVSYDVTRFEDVVSVSEELAARGIQAVTAAAEVGAFLATFRNLQRLFFTVSALIFAIGVLISAILLVKQQNTRFREVGLLAALGYPRGAVNGILLGESGLLCAVAAAFSGGLSLLALAVGKLLRFPILLTGGQVLLAMGLAAGVILVISVLANIRLLRAEPAEALRK